MDREQQIRVLIYFGWLDQRLKKMEEDGMIQRMLVPDPHGGKVKVYVKKGRNEAYVRKELPRQQKLEELLMTE